MHVFLAMYEYIQADDAYIVLHRLLSTSLFCEVNYCGRFSRSIGSTTNSNHLNIVWDKWTYEVKIVCTSW